MPVAFPAPRCGILILLGASGAGKSTFARRLFRASEILSSDHFRALVCDNENDQSVTPDAFGLLHQVAQVRLQHQRLCVVDATNCRREDRAAYVRLANAFALPADAVYLNIEEAVCLARTRRRVDRDISEQTVMAQLSALRSSFQSLHEEGFRRVHVLNGQADIESATVVRESDPWALSSKA